jgi:uncharacterized protein YbjT (DUF2867 family)
MSEPVKLALVGATGLIGRRMQEATAERESPRLVAISRREVKLPAGARMEMRFAPVGQWGEVLETVKPDCLACALGTTFAKEGKDADAFRRIDFELVLAVAKAAKIAGVQHFILVSSVGADSGSKNLYLRTKGEVEQAISKLHFRRLDIIRPGLLRGPRVDDSRPLEMLGQVLAPIANLFMHGKYRQYRSVDARKVADTIFALALERPGGKFIHDYDGMIRVLKRNER